MKKQLFFSIVFAVFVLIYGLIQSISTHNALNALRTQNQSLKMQIGKMHSQLNQTLGMGSDAFYAWFDAQHLVNIHLLAISGKRQNIHTEWSGEATATLELLHLLSDSRFSHLTMVRVEDNLTTTIDFSQLALVKNITKTVQVPVNTKPNNTTVTIVNKRASLN